MKRVAILTVMKNAGAELMTFLNDVIRGRVKIDVT